MKDEEPLENKINRKSERNAIYVSLFVDGFWLGEILIGLIKSDPTYTIRVKDVNKDSIPDVILTREGFSHKNMIYIGDKEGNYITLDKYFSQK